MTQTIWYLGDELAPITETVRDADGNVVSLVSATAVFKMRAVGSSTLTVSAAATVLSPKAEGRVQYDWVTGVSTTATTAGQYLAWWVITDGSTTREVGERLIEFREHAPHGYVEVEQLKKTLSLEGMSFADFDISQSIIAATRKINAECSRVFTLDTGSSTVRYYTPQDQCWVEIDDAVTVTAVAIDSAGNGTFGTAWTEGTHYDLVPYNAALRDEPYTALELRPQSGAYFGRYYPRSIRVTGQYGWTTVPADISVACSLLAHRYLKRMRESPYGVVGLGADSTPMRLSRTDPDVYELIEPYTRRRMLI